jgi:hypothetical protein
VITTTTTTTTVPVWQRTRGRNGQYAPEIDKAASAPNCPE